MNIDSMLSVPNSNPNLQPKIKEAREMFRYAAIFFLVAALINGLWGLWNIAQGLFWSATWYGTYYSGYQIFLGIIRIVLAFVALIIKQKFVENIITPIDQGNYKQSEDDMIIYMILGFIFGLVLSGLLILLGYMKFEDVDTQAKNCPDCGSNLRYVQQYQKWYCDNCGDYKVPVHRAQQSSQPPPQQSQQQSPPPQQQSTTSQGPSQQQQPQQSSQQQSPQTSQQQPQQQQFSQSNNCPTCGQQMRYVNQYSRWYCDNCQEYK